MEKNQIPTDDVTKACGAPTDAPAAQGSFSAVGVDRPTALSGFLLGVPANSVADYVPRLGGTFRLAASEPAIASSGTIIRNRPISIARPPVVL